MNYRLEVGAFVSAPADRTHRKGHDVCATRAKVFDNSNKDHSRYVPVLKWVLNGSGRMIYGGTKYGVELRKLRRYLGLIKQLERKGRVIQLPCAEVDAVADELKTRVPNQDFNDEHIAAIVIVSKCCVVCTNDNRAVPFLKCPELYSCHGTKKSKIYQSKRNKNLCCSKYVAQICR